MSVILAGMGIPCLVLEPQTEPVLKPGETLPPNAAHLVSLLNMEEALQHPAHRAHTGNLVYWEQDEPQQRYFLNEPGGNGWHLHRGLFEQQLREKATGNNVQLLTGWHCSAVTPTGNGWQLQCSNNCGETKTIETAFLADATGRAARIARLLGVPRISADKLTAYSAWLPASPSGLQGTTFIEAVEEGWWYAAPLSDNKTIVCFFTDADIHQLPEKNILPQWWFNKWAKTKRLKEYFTPPLATPNAVMVHPASTSALQQIAGKNWLALGDAAFTTDPLASYGLTAAMGSAVYAANAIRDCLNNNPDAPAAYQWAQQNAFNNCMGMLQHQYGRVQRWPGSLFWERRRSGI